MRTNRILVRVIVARRRYDVVTYVINCYAINPTGYLKRMRNINI